MAEHEEWKHQEWKHVSVGVDIEVCCVRALNLLLMSGGTMCRLEPEAPRIHVHTEHVNEDGLNFAQMTLVLEITDNEANEEDRTLGEDPGEKHNHGIELLIEDPLDAQALLSELAIATYAATRIDREIVTGMAEQHEAIKEVERLLRPGHQHEKPEAE